MRKPGCIEPVVIFVRNDGHVMLAPYSSAPCPSNCRREELDTLAAVDRLEKVLQSQEEREAEKELILDMGRTERASQMIRDRIYSHITSSATPQWEKDFLKEYLKLRDDRKRARYQERHKNLWYLYARHHDLGDRRADVEEFNWQKHEVKT